MRSLPVLVAVACLSIADHALHAADVTAGAVWMTDFTAAQAEAQKLHRPLVVHFHTQYCPPCRKMEQEVLHTPQVLKLLDGGFVAVKVNLSSPANEKVRARFQVNTMPTDLVLSPDGKAILSRTEGYAPENGDKQKYVSALTRIDAKYVAEGKRLPRAATGPQTEIAANNSAKPAEAAVAGTVNPSKLVPDPVDPFRVEEGSNRPAPETATISALPDRAPPVLAMDGYCPVTLRNSRSWKAGQKEFSLEHERQVFYFTSAANRDEFQANPARFAPRLMGCDPVTLVESDLAIRGSTQFGAFFDGQLFLFESDDTRTKFRKTPGRYSHVKHVLKPEEIKDVHNVASTTVLK